MESDLAKLSVKLEEAQEQVESIQWLVKVNLHRAVMVSFPCSSLTPWSFVGCLSMLLLSFAGSGGDVMPQVPYPPDGAHPDGRA